MRDPWEWELEDLQSLIGLSESQRLEFKSSALLSKNQEHIALELSKEVSAFANTEGGTIVIGIAEGKQGKIPVADRLDGVGSEWPSQRIQQLVEGNISPHLVGLRFRAIPLDAERARYAHVIHVPAGTTAYQSKDYRYYGRSEYESKPLPDYVVRLLMLRGKLPSATLRVVEKLIEDTPVSLENARGDHTLDEWLAQFDGLSPKEPVPVTRYRFSTEVRNTGEVNIYEYRARLQVYRGLLLVTEVGRSVKDGWPTGTGPYGLASSSTMQVDIYPQSGREVNWFQVFVPDGLPLRKAGLRLKWTIWLKDTQPFEGEIDLADEWDREKTDI